MQADSDYMLGNTDYLAEAQQLLSALQGTSAAALQGTSATARGSSLAQQVSAGTGTNLLPFTGTSPLPSAHGAFQGMHQAANGPSLAQQVGALPSSGLLPSTGNGFPSSAHGASHSAAGLPAELMLRQPAAQAVTGLAQRAGVHSGLESGADALKAAGVTKAQQQPLAVAHLGVSNSGFLAGPAVSNSGLLSVAAEPQAATGSEYQQQQQQSLQALTYPAAPNSGLLSVAAEPQAATGSDDQLRQLQLLLAQAAAEAAAAWPHDARAAGFRLGGCAGSGAGVPSADATMPGAGGVATCRTCVCANTSYLTDVTLHVPHPP